MPSLWPSSPSPLVSHSRGCLPRRTTTPSVLIKCVGWQFGVCMGGGGGGQFGMCMGGGGYTTNTRQMVLLCGV